MAIQWQKAKVVQHMRMGQIFSLLRFKSNEVFEFAAGQHIVVKIHEQRLAQYSLMSTPGIQPFELLIQYVSGGEATAYFMDLKVGDEIEYMGPLGNYAMQNDGAEQIVLMGTGSGVAPLLCMIRDMLRVGDNRSVWLYFGLRFEENVIMQEELADLVKQFNDRLQVRTSLSQPSADWQGDRGYVTEWLKKDHGDLSQAGMYICGGKELVISAELVGTRLGCTRIYTELFW